MVTEYPLPPADGTLILGSAPLPDDFVPPEAHKDVDFGALYTAGIRGRQVAYHLAGEDFRTSRQAVDDRREKATKERQDKKSGASERKVERELIRVLAGNTADLRRLVETWGSRLRIRCTDEEIYFRLTGSHQQVSRSQSELTYGSFARSVLRFFTFYNWQLEIVKRASPQSTSVRS